MNNLFAEKKIELDDIKVRKMRFKIFMVEKDNYHTGKLSRDKMKAKIRRIIIEEYKKNIGG